MNEIHIFVLPMGSFTPAARSCLGVKHCTPPVAVRMAFLFNHEVDGKLPKELLDFLCDNNISVEVAKWLADMNITKVQALADFASDRGTIINNVARVAGLDPDDPIACQPLVTAWRNADAVANAELEAMSKGQEPEVSDTLSSDQRIKLDEACAKHFKFRWPSSMQPDDVVLGRMASLTDVTDTGPSNRSHKPVQLTLYAQPSMGRMKERIQEGISMVSQPAGHFAEQLVPAGCGPFRQTPPRSCQNNRPLASAASGVVGGVY